MPPSSTLQAELPRTEWVYQVCDELAAEGVKPTLRLVRARGRVRGSDGDVQGDINAWFDRLLHRHTAANLDDSIPGVLADAFRNFWQMALDEAGKQFDAERDKSAEASRQLQSQLDESVAAAAESAATNLRLGSELAQATQTIATLSAALNKSEGQLSDLASRFDLQTIEIQSQNRAISQLHETHAARISDIIREHESRVREVHTSHDRVLQQRADDHAARMAEVREQMALAEGRYQALEQRSLREIDSAREAAKEKDRQLRAAMQTIADLESAAASAKLANGVLAAKFEETVAHSDQLKKDLLMERQMARELSAALASFKSAFNQPNLRKKKASPPEKPADDTGGKSS